MKPGSRFRLCQPDSLFTYMAKSRRRNAEMASRLLIPPTTLVFKVPSAAKMATHLHICRKISALAIAAPSPARLPTVVPILMQGALQLPNRRAIHQVDHVASHRSKNPGTQTTKLEIPTSWHHCTHTPNIGVLQVIFQQKSQVMWLQSIVTLHPMFLFSTKTSCTIPRPL